MPLACLDVNWMRGLVNSSIIDIQDHLGESTWLDAAKEVFFSASGTTCVLIHHCMLIFWKSASLANECAEDWNYHCDGSQRVRVHHLGEGLAESAAVAWVDLSHAKGNPSGTGALAMLHKSGWLTLYRHDGDIAHKQRVFRPHVQNAQQWAPVIAHSNGMLLLTAPNAVYLIQEEEIASFLDCCESGADLTVAAHPWAPNLGPPQYGADLQFCATRPAVLQMDVPMLHVHCRSLTSFPSCGCLMDNLLGESTLVVNDDLLCTSEAPAMAWIQFSDLRRKRAQGKCGTPEVSKLGTQALEMAAQWAAQGIVKFANAVDGVQGTVIPCSAEETWVIVDDRHMQNIALSPDRLLAACTDNKGRVLLVDSVSKTMLRCWKGYRDAQVAWIRWRVGDGAACSVHHPHPDRKTQKCNLRNGDVLVIYAPNREALEMWLPRCGRKLCTFRCRNRCKLFQVSKHADSMLLDQSGHIEYLRQILGQAT